MKNNNKGISLVSLVVIIVATIILISVVITVGYDYIQESNRSKTIAVVKLISDAAKDKQEEMHQVDSSPMHYIGYPLKSDGLDKISGLPDGFAVATGDAWYFIDANSAEQLGVVESDRYIEKDLNSTEISEVAKVVLVNYVTGEAYLVEINKNFLGETIEDSTCNESEGRMHLWTAQTCLKGSYCMACRNEHPTNGDPLGHSYLPATCTSAAMCERCLELDLTQPATGHNFELDGMGEEKWTTDATRHWKECTICGTKKETAAHEKGYVRILITGSTNYDAQYHRELCSICAWQSVKTSHEIEYEVIGDTTHRRYCTLCEYSEEHTDSGWITDDNAYHWKECDEECDTEGGGHVDCIEGGKLFYDEHEDDNHDGICDVCSKVLDTTPPNSFTSEGSYANVTATTTNKVQVTAYTQDNFGVKGYKFAIDEDGDGIIDWESVSLIETEDTPATKIFENLVHNTTHKVYVIAMDEAENTTTPHEIQATTKKVPDVKIVDGTLPSGYVNSSFEVEFEIDESTMDASLDIAEFSIEYSVDGGTTWVSGSKVTIDKETFDLLVRAKDTRTPVPNAGDSNSQTITNLDKTAPTITIAAKDGDDPSVLKTSHTAVVTVTDDKSQVGAGTTIKYAWSLSNTTQPTSYTTVTTGNTATTGSVSIEVVTPTGGLGNYYLWIDEGVEDTLGNATTEAVCSNITFNTDDQDVTLSNIRMYNANPEISGQSGYVKTNGTVTVTFAAAKALGAAPTVQIGGITATTVTSTDNINWTATITATTAMSEGELSLKISDIITLAGKTSSNEYTEQDLTEGPVIYDATLPELEYVDK